MIQLTAKKFSTRVERWTRCREPLVPDSNAAGTAAVVAAAAADATARHFGSNKTT